MTEGGENPGRIDQDQGIRHNIGVESEPQRRPAMSKHPIDHDRARDDAKVAKQYSRIEREQASGLTDPKVRAMTKAGHATEAPDARLRAFLKIDREQDDS
jgi:hypothetical protein